MRRPHQHPDEDGARSIGHQKHFLKLSPKTKGELPEKLYWIKQINSQLRASRLFIRAHRPCRSLAQEGDGPFQERGGDIELGRVSSGREYNTSTPTSGRPGESPQSPLVVADDQSSDGSVVIDEGRSTPRAPRNTRQANQANLAQDAIRARNYAQHLAAYHAAQRRESRPDGDMPWHRQGILLGVHAHSPFPNDDRKHVVLGKIDRRGTFIKRVVNYNRNGGLRGPRQVCSQTLKKSQKR
ncbi:MAG: hypothetical protein M1816_003031 [Peltula sp. TS41687]|nr:MAG: hypothetical protein M1816_003031 [Peltula sp. TS41687]